MGCAEEVERNEEMIGKFVVIHGIWRVFLSLGKHVIFKIIY